MKPSDFLAQPFDSVYRKSETETVARNIMVILSKTGDTFRCLTWDEYKEHRQKDGNFSDKELAHFDDASPYTQSETLARLFSPTWEKVGEW